MAEQNLAIGSTVVNRMVRGPPARRVVADGVAEIAATVSRGAVPDYTEPVELASNTINYNAINANRRKLQTRSNRMPDPLR